LIDEATHRAVFTFVLTEVAKRGLLKGKSIGIDATTLEANAAMKSLVRRDSGESYMEYLRRLAKQAGVEASDEELRRADRKRKKIQRGLGEPARRGRGSDEDEGGIDTPVV
jgi:hypothetical protein